MNNALQSHQQTITHKMFRMVHMKAFVLISPETSVAVVFIVFPCVFHCVGTPSFIEICSLFSWIITESTISPLESPSSWYLHARTCVQKLDSHYLIVLQHFVKKIQLKQALTAVKPCRLLSSVTAVTPPLHMHVRS